MIIKKTDESSIEIGNPFYSIVDASTDFSFNPFYSRVKGNSKLNIGGLVAGVDGNSKLNIGGLAAGVDGDSKLNIGGLIAVVNGNSKLNIGALSAEVKGDSKLNIGALAAVNGDSKLNIGGLIAVVNGNSKLNIGAAAEVKGNSKLNIGAAAEVKGDSKLNIGAGYSKVGRLGDYTIGDICPKITKYLPKFIREIYFPGINTGAVTRTTSPQDSLILGVYNQIKDNRRDYIALGLLNRVVREDGKINYHPFISARISIDGIFTHKKERQNLPTETSESNKSAYGGKNLNGIK